MVAVMVPGSLGLGLDWSAGWRVAHGTTGRSRRGHLLKPGIR